MFVKFAANPEASRTRLRPFLFGSLTMALNQELRERVEAAAASLTKNDFLRPGLSFNDFIKDFSELLAQAKADEIPLTAAGMDFSSMPLYEAYLEILVTDHAERVNAEADTGAATAPGSTRADR